MEINKEYKFCATLIAPPVNVLPLSITLREKCAYLQLFWFIFSRIQFDCGTIRTRITPNTGTFYAVLLCEVKFVFVEFMFIQEKIKFSFIQSFIHSLLGFRTYYTYLQLFSSVTEKKLLQEILQKGSTLIQVSAERFVVLLDNLPKRFERFFEQRFPQKQ